VRPFPPRKPQGHPAAMRLSGLERLVIS